MILILFYITFSYFGRKCSDVDSMLDLPPSKGIGSGLPKPGFEEGRPRSLDNEPQMQVCIEFQHACM